MYLVPFTIGNLDLPYQVPDQGDIYGTITYDVPVANRYLVIPDLVHTGNLRYYSV